MMKILLVMVAGLFAAGCSPPRYLDSAQSPEQIGRWRAAAARLQAATGLSWEPKVKACKGRGCAYTVPKSELPKGVLGEGTYFHGDAKVSETLRPGDAEHVTLHELLHTLPVWHVTSRSVMNPSVRKGRDCISEAELFQICTLRRCAWQKPECEVEPGWKVLVEIREGVEVPISSKLWKLHAQGIGR